MAVIIFLLALFSSTVFANQAGVISVLEAPLFLEADESTRVVQYKRKGEEIDIHPSQFVSDLYTKEEFDKTYDKYQHKYPDPFFTKERTFVPSEDERFYKTFDNRGREAYILKEHVVLRTNDSRESLETPVDPDPTDYRIEEPLPEGYPFLKDAPFRGHYALLIGRDNQSTFDYKDSIQDTGYGLVYGLDIVGAWPIKWDEDKRFLFGMQFNLQQTDSQTTTTSSYFTESKSTMGVGPYFSYDMWRTKRWVVASHMGIIFNFNESLEMEQKRGTVTDTAQYNGLSLATRFGASLHVKEVLHSLAGIMDVSMFVKSPHSLKLGGSPEQEDWWPDSFSTSIQTTMTLSFGLHQNY